MATTLTALHSKGGRYTSTVRPTVLAVLHPKGGVGRSTSVWQLCAELALRGKRVRIEDLDQGRHLSRAFERHPLGLDGLQPAPPPIVELPDGHRVLPRTAPQPHRDQAL